MVVVYIRLRLKHKVASTEIIRAILMEIQGCNDARLNVLYLFAKIDIS
jgi:hypothetical protein